MLQSSSWEEEEVDNPNDESCDPHDDFDLEFMLYSQLHYEQTDITDGDRETSSVITREVSKEISEKNEDSEGFTEKNSKGRQVIHDVKSSTSPTYCVESDKKLENKKTGLKRSGSQSLNSPRKKNRKIDPSLKDTIVIDSSSDSSVIEISPKTVRKEKVIAKAESVVFPSTSIIISDSTNTDSPGEISLSNDVSSISDSDSGSSSSLDTQHLQVHMDYKQKPTVLRQNDSDEKWKINEEDRLAGIVGNQGTSGKRFGGTGIGGRYYQPSSVKCFNCNEVGHLSKDCPKPKKSQICFLCGFTGHFFRDCPQSLCYNCNQPGHTAKECTVRKQWRFQECQRCCMQGHSHQNCPDSWRQFHITTSLSKPCPVEGQSECINNRMSCYNCASKRHFGYECPRDRIDRYSMATYPLIAKYDKWKFLRAFFRSVNGEKPLSKKEIKRQRRKEQKEKEKTLKSKSVKSFAEAKRTVKSDNRKPLKKKQKHNWDSKFSTFSDTGKPVKSKKQRRKANQNQRKEEQQKKNANGFRLSTAVKFTQRKMRR